MTPEIRFRLEDMLEYASEGVTLLGAASLTDVLAEQPQIPWQAAIGQRHILVHGYGKVLVEEVIRTIREDFPSLIVNLTDLPAETKAP